MIVINNDQWKLVAEASDEFSAELIKGHLVSDGIEVSMISQLDSAKLLTIGEQAIVKIYVPLADTDRAKELLSAFDHEAESAVNL